jgi:hypothetical protein
MVVGVGKIGGFNAEHGRPLSGRSLF